MPRRKSIAAPEDEDESTSPKKTKKKQRETAPEDHEPPSDTTVAEPATRRRRSGRLLPLYAPRLPVVSSAFVFGLFALLAPWLDHWYHRLATDGRLVSDVPTVSYELGRFQVKWDKSDLQLKVRRRVGLGGRAI